MVDSEKESTESGSITLTLKAAKTSLTAEQLEDNQTEEHQMSDKLSDDDDDDEAITVIATYEDEELEDNIDTTTKGDADLTETTDQDDTDGEHVVIQTTVS